MTKTPWRSAVLPTQSGGLGQDDRGPLGARIAPVTRKRNLRLAWMAAGLIAVSVLGVQWRVASAGERVPLLALARPVAAGETLAATDLKEVDLPPNSGVVGISVSDEDTVVGQRAAVSLWPGAPLARQALAASAPPPGMQVTALVVKEGHYPAGLAAGDSVLVYDRGASAPGGQSGAASGSVSAPVSALVLVVRPATEPGQALVTLQTAAADPARLAAVAEPQLAVTSTEGR